jgi:hypothetical protein
MSQEGLSAPNLSLNEAKRQFEEWRRMRKGCQRIPEELWEAAVRLSKEHSISRVSKALRLNYTDLKNRVHDQENDKQSIIGKEPFSKFIELEIERPVHIPLPPSECIVEMEDGRGAKMKMCFRGRTDFDLLELGKAFWSKGS